MLLQKRDGRFYLLLWQEVACYDAAKRTEIPVTPQELIVVLPPGVQNATAYVPSTSGVKPTASFDRPKTVPLRVSDELMILDITAVSAK